MNLSKVQKWNWDFIDQKKIIIELDPFDDEGDWTRTQIHNNYQNKYMHRDMDGQRKTEHK